jgi:hypothetical protein
MTTTGAKRSRKAPARGAARRRANGSAFERIERGLPPTLREYSRRVQALLDRLERQIDKLEVQARKRAARLIRDASHALGRLEAQGERSWLRLTTKARRDTLRVLSRLERAVEPPKRTRRTAVRRQVKSAVESAAAAMPTTHA